MNLCIDQGNSRTKIGIFTESGEMLNNFLYKSFHASDIEKLLSLYPITNSIVSSVINIDPTVVNTLHKLCQRFVLFDHNTPIPICSGYDTPQTLGQDRIASAIGANFLKPNTNLLIIDAGSAITYDFVSADNVYCGGNIAPGIKMRFTVLYQMTQKLPMVDIDEKQVIPLFGKNTNDAITAGVVRGIRFEIEGYRQTLTKRVGNFETFLTGGNAAYLSGLLRNKEIHIEKNLVLTGLNQILEYQKRNR